MLQPIIDATRDEYTKDNFACRRATIMITMKFSLPSSSFNNGNGSSAGELNSV